MDAAGRQKISSLLRHCPYPCTLFSLQREFLKLERGKNYSLSTFKEKACISVFKVKTRSGRKQYFQHIVTNPTLNGNVILKATHFKV